MRYNVHRLAKIPSRDLGYKVERWADWQGYRTTEAEISSWAQNRNLNCAVNCRTVKALDIDIEDAAVVAKLVAEFERIAGSPVLVRGRPNSQRVLIPFKVSGPLESSAVIGRAGVVEFLSNGKMFVLAGGHPSGVRYVHTKGVIPTLLLAQVKAYQTTVGQALEIEMPFTVCCASIQKEEQCLSD